MSAMDMRELDSPGVSVPGEPSAEAVATSREPQHWGRAMA
jgi:hypothetical protein